MRTLQLVVAALLLTFIASSASAADEPGPKSKTAQKMLATLNMVGVNDQDVKDFVSQADQHINQNYFYFGETNTLGGSLSLRAETSHIPSARVMELHYAPKDSHLEFTAHTNSAMLSYRIPLGR